MITCPRCHHHNPEQQTHCELCGAVLSSEEAVSTPAPATARPSLPPEVDVTAFESEAEFSIEPAQDEDPQPSALEKVLGKPKIKPPAIPALGAGRPRPKPAVTAPIPIPEEMAALAKDKKPPPVSTPEPAAEQPAGLARLLHDALASPTESKPVFQGAPKRIDEAMLTNPVLKPVPALSSASSRDRLSVDEELSNQELSDFLLDALSHVENPYSVDSGAVSAVSLGEPLGESLHSIHSMDASAAMPEPAQSINCKSCNRANPEGMLYCVYCGTSLEDKADAQAQVMIEVPEPSRSLDATITCPSCKHINPEDNLFCGACGYGLQSTPEDGDEDPRILSGAISAVQRKPSPWDIRLVSINEDGSDGLEIPLDHTKTIVGRTGDTRFPTDAFLSPKHACLTIEHGELHIEDLYSLNGTFLRLRDEVTLTAGDVVLMGRQVLRFEKFEQTITPKARSSDGTRYMGSPLPGGQYKLLQVGIGGVIQNVYCIPDSGAVLGREKGDIIFPRDKFMSGRHAQIYPREDNSYCLVDLNSSNGTWLKIWEKTRLQHNDFIFMGQQLFRVEVRGLNKPR